MFLPVGKSDVAFGAMCAFDTFRIYICHSERKYKGPQKILCTFGEKAHTSKRVSVIACDNAISKVQCATHLPEGNHIIKPTQDTFVLAWRNGGAKKHAVGRVFESRFVLPCYLPTNPLMASSISL